LGHLSFYDNFGLKSSPLPHCVHLDLLTALSCNEIYVTDIKMLLHSLVCVCRTILNLCNAAAESTHVSAVPDSIRLHII